MTQLFHYTNANGLIGILRGNCLWATDYRFLNDRSELNFALSIYEDRVGSGLLDHLEARAPISDDATWDAFARKRVAEYIAHNQANRIRQSSSQTIGLFVFSMCAHNHDRHEYQHGLLSQWRGYGGDEGYAIEFDTPTFEKHLEDDCSLLKEPAWIFDKCLYGESYKENDEINSALGNLIADHIELIKLETEPGTSTPKQLDDKRQLLEGSINTIFSVFLRLKDPAFEEEQEYRVILPAPSQRVAQEVFSQGTEPQKKRRDIHFRQSQFGIAPYVKFLAGNVVPTVKRIIVGPGQRQLERVGSLEMMRDECAANFEISVSGVPYGP